MASPVAPIDATADVYFFSFPGGTRKAKQVTAGSLCPRKCLDGRTVKQSGLPSSATDGWEGPGLVPTQEQSKSMPLKTSAAPAVGHLVRRNLQ